MSTLCISADCDRQAIARGMCKKCYRRDWGNRNRDRNRELARQSWARLRQEILAAYGGKCACCGESTPEFLSVDHIAGGGWAERKAKGPNKVYRDIRIDGFPPTYQLLCHNCNQAKGFYGRCPHDG